MSKKKSGISKKDVGTIIVAVCAIMLVSFAFIRMFTSSRSKLENEAGETTVRVCSTVNEDGEVVFYTMIERYTDSGLHASMRYRTTTTEAESTEEESSEVETTIVYVTDENGERVTDENGEEVTEIETVPPPQTTIEIVTDENGEAKTDENGAPVTQEVTVTETTTEETTTVDVWSTESTTAKKGIKTQYTNESAMASTIVSEINKERAAAEIDALGNDSKLSSAARAYSVAMALGRKATKSGSRTYHFKTANGGAEIYDAVVSQTDATSGSYLNVGVGVIKYKGEYYTTIILD